MRFREAMVAVFLSACGGSQTPATSLGPERSLTAPSDSAERAQALQQFAERAFRTLQHGHAVELVFDEVALGRLLNSPSATRAGGQRRSMPAASGMAPRQFELLRDARFDGACFQGLHDEAEGSVVGLLQPGWMFERVLLVGSEPTGRLAIWLEGEFLWTDQGFGAISIQAVEAPRRNHADLELAVCDVDLGVHEPLAVVSGATLDH